MNAHAPNPKAGPADDLSASRRPADWLSLAAAPTFAVMALLAGVPDGGAPDMPCLAPHHASPLTGMVPMYLLMSLFHAAPWLRLLAGRRGGA